MLMKEKKPEIKTELGRVPEIRTDAINAIEERFALQQKITGEIDKTRMQIAHPGWVQLTAAHPTPELPKLGKERLMLPKMEKPGSDVKLIGLTLAMPELGEARKRQSEEKKK